MGKGERTVVLVPPHTRPMYARLAKTMMPIVALCSGCATGISVKHVAGNTPQVGTPWNLPMTQFTVAITRHIVKCGPTIQGVVEILPSAGIAVDPAQRYVLSSNGWFATSDITSTLAPSGVTTALNATSTDQTATVISNVLGTVAQIAIGAAARGAEAETELCQSGIANAAHELYPDLGPSLKEQVEKDTANLAIATAKVSLLNAQVVADSTLKPTLVTALKEQANAQAALTKNQEALVANLKLTTDVQIVTWPHDASSFRRDTPYTLSNDVLNKWAKPTVDSAMASSEFDVYLALFSLDSGGREWVLPAAPTTADVKVGVPVRLARIARLYMCVTSQCQDKYAADARPGENESAADFVVLQTGQMYVLPVAGGTFKSETAAINLDPNGLPTILHTAESVAAAAGLSGAAKDAATQWAALPGSVRAAELARTQAETNQDDADAALASAQANITGQTATLAAQTALINAQSALASAKENAGLSQQTAGPSAHTAVLSAQGALATAQLNAQTADRTSVLAAETALINAQVAQINAAAALAKAQVTVP